MVKVAILIGMLTWYRDPYVGEPMYCGGTYDGMGIAVDLQHTQWKCGDLVMVKAEGHTILRRITDNGPLSKYYIRTHEELVPIIADFGYREWRWGTDLSIEAVVTNITEQLRHEMEIER